MYDLGRLSHHNTRSIVALACLALAVPMACGPRSTSSGQRTVLAGTAQEDRAGSPMNEAIASEHSNKPPAVPASQGNRSPDRPVALIDGRRVTWSQLQPLLAEASGGMILEEHILHQQLNEQLAEANITLTSDATKNEQVVLLESLNDDPDVALRLLEEIRLRQGLGDHRYDNLLWRNAALRALVQENVELQDDAITRLYDVMYGPKRTGRIAVFSDLVDAQRANERAEAGEPFIDIVVDSSIAESSSTGGKFGPISRNDPEVPGALRETLWRMEVGQHSAPVLFQERYAIIQLLDEAPAESITLDEARPELERVLRLTQERLLMSQLARQLVEQADVTIFNQPLKQGHEQYQRQESP